MNFQSKTYMGSFITRLRGVIVPSTEAWLVGGAVRDQLIGRASHDLDVILPADTRKVAKKTADALGANFFALDDTRGMYRVLLTDNGQTDIIDFSRIQGDNLDEDLKARDFTMNAIAIRLHEPFDYVDPLNGRQDIIDRILRPCNETSITNDPVRAIRAVRLALAFDLRMAPGLTKLIREAGNLLEKVSVERKRDELFKILEGPHPASGIRMLDQLGLLSRLLPDLPALKGVSQPPPHTLDVWEHTLAVLSQLNTLLDLFLAPEAALKDGGNLMLGLAAGKLGHFRESIQEHYRDQLNPFRSRRAINLMAALLHDIAKPETRSVGTDGRIHFYRHEIVGAEKVADIARRLALGEAEINMLVALTANHMKPRYIQADDPLPTRRNIFRFYRHTGASGVDTCFLALADFLAKTNLPPAQEEWSYQLDRVAKYLEGWFEQRSIWVEPEKLLNGNEIMQIFGLKPGRLIGDVLDRIQEAQAAGEICNRAEALEMAKIIIFNPAGENDEE